MLVNAKFKKIIGDEHRIKWLIRFHLALMAPESVLVFDLNRYLAKCLFPENKAAYFTKNIERELFGEKVEKTLADLEKNQEVVVLRNAEGKREYSSSRLAPVLPTTLDVDRIYIRRKLKTDGWLRLNPSRSYSVEDIFGGWLYSSLTPEQFEKFCILALGTSSGIQIAQSNKLRDGRDGGVDATGTVKGRNLFVQAKKWSPERLVDADTIKECEKNLSHNKVFCLVFITTSGYADDVKKIKADTIDKEKKIHIKRKLFTIKNIGAGLDKGNLFRIVYGTQSKQANGLAAA